MFFFVVFFQLATNDNDQSLSLPTSVNLYCNLFKGTLGRLIFQTNDPSMQVTSWAGLTEQTLSHVL